MRNEVLCGCGCEAVRGRETLEGVCDGVVFMDDPKTGVYKSFCVDCFVYEMTRLLRRSPYAVAEAMGLEYLELKP